MTLCAAQLQDFVRYVQNHIRGDEKSEAQSFLNRWFRAIALAILLKLRRW